MLSASTWREATTGLCSLEDEIHLSTSLFIFIFQALIGLRQFRVHVGRGVLEAPLFRVNQEPESLS